MLGTASALVLGRVLAAQFPRSLVLASAALASAAAASAASWLPARRAARIDPLEALRQE